MTAAQVVCVWLPVQIVSEANIHAHWRSKASRVKSHRMLARTLVGGLAAAQRFGPGHITITLTRIGPRKLDDDNLASGFKATRDGIADCIGIDDGNERLIWRYEQRTGKPKEYGAEVRIEGSPLTNEDACK